MARFGETPHHISSSVRRRFHQQKSNLKDRFRQIEGAAGGVRKLISILVAVEAFVFGFIPVPSLATLGMKGRVRDFMERSSIIEKFEIGKSRRRRR